MIHVARATKYVEDVLAEKVPACIHVKNACKRHVNDLAWGAERGFEALFGLGNSVGRFSRRQFHRRFDVPICENNVGRLGPATLGAVSADTIAHLVFDYSPGSAEFSQSVEVT